MESANKMKLTYTNVNGYLIPNITYKSSEQMERLGKYGFLRREYLKNHKNSLYQVMLLQDSIGEHLLEVDKAARKWEEVILKQLEEKELLPDKKADQMAWVRADNQHRAIAEDRILLQETSPEARAWYAKEAQEQAWSVRTLQRNISSQYYYRMLMSQNVEPVEKEMKELTASYQADKLEFIKNPVIAEFLGLSSNTDFTESELEQRIITHIQKFLMELGKGYAFVARQQHIRTEKEDYYIDLVFYNYILKCFVLIDLKTSKITHTYCSIIIQLKQ